MFWTIVFSIITAGLILKFWPFILLGISNGVLFLIEKQVGWRKWLKIYLLVVMFGSLISLVFLS